MSRTVRGIAALLITAVALGVFGVTLVHALWYAPDQTDQTAASQQFLASSVGAVPGFTPMRLIIPALSIDANVQKVGIAASGAMAVPSNFTDVAWYKYGAMPGQMGSAVIDGHVDNGLALPGVFKHLNNIKAGDDIYVQNASSTRVHFVVEEVELYPYKDVPTNLIFNQKDAARLTLITCDGAWVEGERTYDHRLVVYAKISA